MLVYWASKTSHKCGVKWLSIESQKVRIVQDRYHCFWLSKGERKGECHEHNDLQKQDAAQPKGNLMQTQRIGKLKTRKTYEHAGDCCPC